MNNKNLYDAIRQQIAANGGLGFSETAAIDREAIRLFPHLCLTEALKQYLDLLRQGHLHFPDDITGVII